MFDLLLVSLFAPGSYLGAAPASTRPRVRARPHQ
jgi:hypothetical protein